MPEEVSPEKTPNNKESKEEKELEKDPELAQIRETVLDVLKTAKKAEPKKSKRTQKDPGEKIQAFLHTKKEEKELEKPKPKKETTKAPVVANNVQPIKEKKLAKKVEKKERPSADLQEHAGHFYDHFFGTLKKAARKMHDAAYHEKSSKDSKEKSKKTDKGIKPPTGNAALPAVSKTLVEYKPSLSVFGLNLLITVVLLGGLFIALVGVGIYNNTFFSNTTRNDITKLLPYPAGIVNGHFLTIDEYRGEIAALNRFYAVQVDAGIFNDYPESGRVQDIVWERFVQNALLEDLAAEYDIVITEERLRVAVDDIIGEVGSEEEFTSQIAFLYGWEVSTFLDKVIKPFLLREALAATLFKDEQLRSEKEALAQELSETLQETPELFPQYAEEYSDDAVSRVAQGDLGYITAGTVAPEIDTVLQQLEVGEVSEVVTTGEGFEVLYMEEIVTEIDGTVKYRPRRILIRYPTFEELLTQMRLDAKIYRFVQ